MRRATIIFFAIISAVFLITSCGGGGGGGTVPKPTPEAKPWTILIYLDGDNDLSEAALADLVEMENATPSDEVNLVVQLDLAAGVETKRYIINNGQRELIKELGELDMTDPVTLRDFLTWGKDNYPADKTALILWDHGNGWDQNDGPSPPSKLAKNISEKSLLLDWDNDKSFASNHSISDAIVASGIELDILGLDASSMGTIEMYYEFRNDADIIIASQELGQSAGWDYTPLFSMLANNPQSSAEEFSRQIVTTYEDYYENVFALENPGFEKSLSITALWSSALEDLGAEVDKLAETLSARLIDQQTKATTIDLIGSARSQVQFIDPYLQFCVYIDLLHFSTLLGIDTQIDEIMEASIIKEYHGSARPNANGISIVFFSLPCALQFGTYDINYRGYDSLAAVGNAGDFLVDLGWDEFLDIYYSEAGLL